MRIGILAAAGLALLASSFVGAAQAVPLSAPAALNGAATELGSIEKVGCWNGCGYSAGYSPYPYYGYPLYRVHRPYHRVYHRRHYRPRAYYNPCCRSYGPSYRTYYRPYYRPYLYGPGYNPWWLPGPFPPYRPHYVGRYWY